MESSLSGEFLYNEEKKGKKVRVPHWQTQMFMSTKQACKLH